MEYSNQIIIGLDELRHIFRGKLPRLSRDEIVEAIAAYLEGNAITQHELEAYVMRLPIGALHNKKDSRRHLHYPKWR